MPYSTLSGAPQALRTAGLTLAQMNQWARYFDEAEDAGSKYPGAIAWVRFKYKHRKVGGKWVRKIKKSIEELMKVKPYLLGYTLQDQIPKTIDTDVETIEQAKKYSKMNIYKINWRTGKVKMRMTRGGLRLANIMSQRKAPEPHEWLDFEGVIQPGHPGATRSHVGVMTKIDAGIVEHGMRKPYAHEWFKRGGKLTGKLVFRELPTAIRPEVEKFETEDEIEKYCQEHEEEIVKEVEKLEFEELIKQADQPLPEAKPIPSIRRTFWIMMQPKDQTPYALSSDAVKKGWMPPLSFSCMPKSDREKVPKEFQFWEAKSKEEAKRMRDELVASKIFKATVKGKFVLQYQTWRGPIQIRFGPTTKRWHLWVDGTRLNHVELNLDPTKNDSLRAMVETTGDRSLIGRGVKGSEVIKPGTKFNPTKNTPSTIERIDTGSCLVLEDSREFKKIEFFGKKLKGLWTLKREEPEMEIWVMERSAGPGEKFEKEFIPILKVDYKKHVVYGVVLEPEVWDAQQDIVSVDEIEKAAHDFLAFYRKIDLRHHYLTEKCYPVESYVAPQDMELGGEKVKKGSWILGTKVTDKKIWKDIEDGVLTGFSIVGYAQRVKE